MIEDEMEGRFLVPWLGAGLMIRGNRLLPMVEMHNISMRRMRARLSLIQGKVKLGITFFLVILLLLLTDYFLGIVSILLEKDFETEFSYPLDVDNFPALIENFRNGEAVDYEPINMLYIKHRFLEKADTNCDDFQLMIILVKSAPANIQKRNAIRSTWGNPQYLKNISNFIRSKTTTTNSNKRQHALPRHKTGEPNINLKLVFLIGLIPNHDYAQMYVEKLRKESPVAKINNVESKDSMKTHHGIKQDLEEDITKESNQHKDIVRIDMIDSYTNNTIKTMMGIRYLEEICADFEYTLLADDDMYISIKNLLTFLESPATYPDGDTESSASDTVGQIVDANRLFAGKVLFTKPIRQRIGSLSKWMVGFHEYPFNHYPRFMPAGAILMSKKVVEEFYYASYYTKHFRFDDVYLALMAYKLNIIPFSSKYFHVCHTEDGKCSELIISSKQRNQGEGDDNDNEDDEEYIIAKHGFSPQKLIELWHELTLSGRI